MNPTAKFEVGTDKWHCCFRLRRTDFCADCGRKRPEAQWSSRIDDILEGWRKEKHIYETTVQTYENKITRGECALEKLDSAETWQDVEALWSEFDRYSCSTKSEDIEEAKEQLEENIKRAHSQWAGQVQTAKRKASLYSYWIKTVEELLEMLPTETKKLYDQNTETQEQANRETT